MAAPLHLERWRRKRVPENLYDHDLRKIAYAYSQEYRPRVALGPPEASTTASPRAPSYGCRNGRWPIRFHVRSALFCSP